jgi:hypothetical protein
MNSAIWWQYKTLSNPFIFQKGIWNINDEFLHFQSNFQTINWTSRGKLLLLWVLCILFCFSSTLNVVICRQKVKYAYQAWQHPAYTASPHSQKVEEKRAWFYNNQFQNRCHKQLTNVRTRGVTALDRWVAKQFATGGLNQVLGCTNLALATTGSNINKQVQVVLVK